ncbi:hypothetical protein [Pseudodesulfovibrio tunisiensis]|uniref:hypothetical protein n=1 Tax=Pseudodesulfovibrio tunisiensis TaxID=463192 RepID=UPI001FB4B5DF|nr:hypothetical protein [Pseudodesulfovibrio tunisiensis]
MQFSPPSDTGIPPHPASHWSAIASAGMQARNFAGGYVARTAAIAPDFYSQTSLIKDIARLCDPDEPISDQTLLNVAVKYFFAYVHDGAQADEIPFPEISALFELFGRHQSLNEPDDDIETMHRLRQWSPVLRILADAPRAAHVMRAVINQKAIRPCLDDPYMGVDIGAGTGIMLLAQQIQARRLGYEDVFTWGYQDDPVCGERTHDLVRALGAGSVLLADPGRASASNLLQGRKLTYVANEVVAGIQQSYGAINFFRKYETFFEVAGPGLARTAFFPDGLIVYSRDVGVSLILSRENRFQPPPEYWDATFTPQGLILEGRVTPMHKLGADFYQYIE